MKKLLLFCLVVALAFTMVAAVHIRLVRLELTNKSGCPASMAMNAIEARQFYYLPVVAGTRELPISITYTIVADAYNIKITYLCNGEIYVNNFRMMDYTHNSKLTLLKPVFSADGYFTGEAGMLKYNPLGEELALSGATFPYWAKPNAK